MKTRRRIILMMGTILVGVALVLLDAPLPLILLGTVSMGTMMLVLLSAKETPPAAPAPEEKKNGPVPALRHRIGARFSKKAGAEIPGKKKRSGFGIRIPAAALSFLSLFKRSPVDEEKVREIDALLEMAIRESVSSLDQELATASADTESAAPPPSSAKAEFERELAELGSFEFDDDLEPASLDEKERAASFEEEAAAGQMPEPGTGEEFAFEMDAAFPGMEGDEEKIPPEELSGLDLSDMDPEETSSSLEAMDPDSLLGEEEEADITAAPVEEEPPAATSAQELNLDFSDDGDSEIMDILRSESKKKVHVQDLSLIRAMKDVQVNARDLSAELEEVLGLLEQKIRGSGEGARYGSPVD
ncbi:MAG: hypothetical protein RQ758_02660 [Methanomicrobiaceae archaeon]|nr:hypothetical protein [Methanomicrobiaceae archaeon]